MSRTIRRVPVLGAALMAAGLSWGAAPATADDALANLSIHGFLSQAYARASDESATSIGITKDGTTSYRTAALQFSYAIKEHDRFVLQLSHERIGIDPRQAFLPEVAADWIFYEHRFGDRTDVRVGRIPIPLGIYNQIRDVGTILPFYRPANAIYNETNFFSETVDGALVSHRVPLGRWSLEVDGYGGGWNTLAISGSTGLQPARAHNALGVSSWLRTPVTGLRVGGGFFRTTLRRDLTIPAPANPPVPELRRLWMASVDGSFSRVIVRGEYSQTKDGDSRDRVYAALVGVRPLPKLSVNLEYAKFWVSWFGGPRAGTISSGQRDLALGVNYSFNPGLVAKVEGHDGEGFAVVGPPPMSRYFLTSLAVSF